MLLKYRIFPETHLTHEVSRNIFLAKDKFQVILKISTKHGSGTSEWFANDYSQTIQWRHNGHDDVSNNQPRDCLLNRIFRRRSKKTSTLRTTGLCAGNSPVPGELPAKMASNAGNVSIWWRHHEGDVNESRRDITRCYNPQGPPRVPSIAMI